MNLSCKSLRAQTSKLVIDRNFESLVTCSIRQLCVVTPEAEFLPYYNAHFLGFIESENGGFMQYLECFNLGLPV